MPFARILTATGRRGIEARLAERFPPSRHAELLAARDAHCLALEVETADRAAGWRARCKRWARLPRHVPARWWRRWRRQPQLAARRGRLPTVCSGCSTPLSRTLGQRSHAAARSFRMRDRVLDLSRRSAGHGDPQRDPRFVLRPGRRPGRSGRARRGRWRPTGAALRRYRRSVVRALEPARRAPMKSAAGSCLRSRRSSRRTIDVALSIDTFKAERRRRRAGGRRPPDQRLQRLVRSAAGRDRRALRCGAGRHAPQRRAQRARPRRATSIPTRSPRSSSFFTSAPNARARPACAADVDRDRPGPRVRQGTATPISRSSTASASCTALGYPILFASSRKSFIGRIFDRPAKELLVPSLATAGLGHRRRRAHAARSRRRRNRAVGAHVRGGRARAGARRLTFAERMPGTPATGNSAQPERGLSRRMHTRV